MIHLFDTCRDLTLLSMFLRLTLALISGGCIGAERELKRRSAGFRTHILICLGAAVAALTGQFLAVYMHYYTDMTRLGAQVIAGIGFIGAGAIITTQGTRVRGLTTSAGLWAAGIVGLCYGAGFYEGGIAITILILLAEFFLSKMEWAIRNRTPEITVYLEYKDKMAMNRVTALLKEHTAKIVNSEYGRQDEAEDGTVRRNAILQVRIVKGLDVGKLGGELEQTEGVFAVEIL